MGSKEFKESGEQNYEIQNSDKMFLKIHKIK